MSAIFCDIINLIETMHPRIIAIDGSAASGKSSLADVISERFDCNIIHMDDFFLPPERKTPERLSQPGGNVDYERFIAEIKPFESFTYHKYNCKTGELSPVQIIPKPLMVVEGAYSLHPLLRDMFDLKFFLYTSREVQERRILARNGADMLKRFQNEWIPLENAYFDKLNIKEICDIAVDTSTIY